MKKIVFLMVVCLFLALAPRAKALSFDMVGNNYDYSTAVVDMQYTNGELNLSIKNTGLYNPIITSFTFNAPGNISSLESFISPDGWEASFLPNSIDTPEPFGFFDIAAITGKNVNGGDPQEGIHQGETYDFKFFFTGTGLDSLTEYDFYSYLSYIPDKGKGSNSEAVNFLTRVQQVGPNGELSDVMTTVAPVPEPATLLLFGSGLVGLAIIRKKRKNY